MAAINTAFADGLDGEVRGRESGGDAIDEPRV